MKIEEIEENKQNNIYYKNNSYLFDELVSYVKKYPISCCKVLSRKYRQKYLQQNFNIEKLMNWIINQTNHFSFKIKIQTRVYCIINGIYSLNQFPKCKTCGKTLKQNVCSFSKGFDQLKYCSAKCRANNTQFKQNMLKNKMEKYGNIFGDPKKIVKKRISNNGRKNKKLSESLKNAYKERKDEIQYKKCTTLFKNYGVISPMKSPLIRSKHNIKIKYDNKKFDSLSELAFYIWLIDNNIEFIFQPNTSFKYVFNKKEHCYFPDFKIGDLYFEIKGDQFFDVNGKMCNPYDKSQNGLYEAKHQCMLINNIVILKSNEYCIFEEYVKQKYGPTYLKQFKQMKSK